MELNGLLKRRQFCNYCCKACVGNLNYLDCTRQLASVDLVSYIYGIGYIGIYDFQMISPYTMVDNTVVIFAVLFTFFAVLRSYIVRVLYELMSRCITLQLKVDYHYMLFVIVPLGTNYLKVHKLYLLVLYANIIVSTISYLSTTTITIAKLLHREFKSLKNIYIVGMLCFIGFSVSIPMALSDMISDSRFKGLLSGVQITVLFIGGFKSALVMWLYGVQRFSTDIHYWLGFKPTKYWVLCWWSLPIVLFGLFIFNLYQICQIDDFTEMLVAIIWVSASTLIVEIFQIRTIVKYMVSNHLTNAFKTSRNYGPPDREDREKRRAFSETMRLRKCNHNCKVLDESYDCNHLPMTTRSSLAIGDLDLDDSSDELLNIYEATMSKKDFRQSSAAVDLANQE